MYRSGMIKIAASVYAKNIYDFGDNFDSCKLEQQIAKSIFKDIVHTIVFI